MPLPQNHHSITTISPPVGVTGRSSTGMPTALPQHSHNCLVKQPTLCRSPHTGQEASLTSNERVHDHRLFHRIPTATPPHLHHMPITSPQPSLGPCTPHCTKVPYHIIKWTLAGSCTPSGVHDPEGPFWDKCINPCKDVQYSCHTNQPLHPTYLTSIQWYA